MSYKYTHIEKRHRTAIESLCISMNLTDVTTSAMHKRGSIRLWDPVTAVYYSFHESGYIRRWIPSGHSWSKGHKAYQLNSRNDTANYGSSSIMAGMNEQVVTLINAVPKYRQTISERPL